MNTALVPATQLYEVSHRPVPNEIQVVFVDETRPSLQEKVRSHTRLMRGSLLQKEPVKVREAARLTPDSRMPDLHPILWTLDGCPLVTDEVFELFRDALGWQRCPVSLIMKDERSLNGYHGLAITGRCGRVVPNLNNVKWHEGNRLYVGASLDPASHDGSELCLPVRGAKMLVSTRIAERLATLRLPNTRIEMLSEKLYPADVIDLMIEYRTSVFNVLSDDWLWDPAEVQQDYYAALASSRPI